jgi:sugar/nucleoside kinase (ribokinase family)
MYDIITIGSAIQDVYLFSKKFHICRDTRVATGEVETFTFGTKIELDDILFEIGGGATNTAYTFANQGMKVACLTKVGADGAGEEAKKVLKKAKISTDLVITDPKHRTAHSVIFLAANGERTILVYRGASHDFRLSDVNLKKLRNTKWLYITSIAGNVQLLKRIVDFAAKNKIKVALNPGKMELQHGLKKLSPIFKKSEVLFLNREEAADILKRNYSDESGIKQDVPTLGSRMTVVTQAEKGSLVFDGENIYRVSIKPVKAVDATGAGDAYGSGFVAGYMKKEDIQFAIKLAAANAAGEVMKIGPKQGLIAKNPAEVKRLVKLLKLKIKKIK